MTELTTNLDLHPKILRRDGKEQFAVLPWEEYVRLLEMLEDTHDLLLIEQAKREEAETGEPRVSHEEVMRMFNVS